MTNNAVLKLLMMLLLLMVTWLHRHLGLASGAATRVITDATDASVAANTVAFAVVAAAAVMVSFRVLYGRLSLLFLRVFVLL